MGKQKWEDPGLSHLLRLRILFFLCSFSCCEGAAKAEADLLLIIAQKRHALLKIGLMRGFQARTRAILCSSEICAVRSLSTDPPSVAISSGRALATALDLVTIEVQQNIWGQCEVPGCKRHLVS